MWKRDLTKDLLKHALKLLLCCMWTDFLPRFEIYTNFNTLIRAEVLIRGLIFALKCSSEKSLKFYDCTYNVRVHSQLNYVFCGNMQKQYIKEETLKRLEVDEEVLGEFFREIITPAVSADVLYRN